MDVTTDESAAAQFHHLVVLFKLKEVRFIVEHDRNPNEEESLKFIHDLVEDLTAEEAPLILTAVRKQMETEDVLMNGLRTSLNSRR